MRYFSSFTERRRTLNRANLRRLRDSVRILSDAGELQCVGLPSTDEEIARLLAPSLQLALTAACERSDSDEHHGAPRLRTLCARARVRRRQCSREARRPSHSFSSPIQSSW